MGSRSLSVAEEIQAAGITSTSTLTTSTLRTTALYATSVITGTTIKLDSTIETIGVTDGSTTGWALEVAGHTKLSKLESTGISLTGALTGTSVVLSGGVTAGGVLTAVGASFTGTVTIAGVALTYGTDQFRRRLKESEEGISIELEKVVDAIAHLEANGAVLGSSEGGGAKGKTQRKKAESTFGFSRSDRPERPYWADR